MRDCYATEPYNACGYGGPEATGEFTCVHTCINDLSDGDPVTQELIELCYSSCATPACGLIGDATLVLTTCVDENCSDVCFF